MRRHELKCWPEYFESTWSGSKCFEVRKDDRGFKWGDGLLLREWSRMHGYSGREVRASVGYVLRDGPSSAIQAGFCVFQVENAVRHVVTRPSKDGGT